MTQPTKKKEIIVVLHNPKSGARHATETIDALVTTLQTRGFAPESFSDLNEFEKRVASLHGQSILRAVIAAGGDGTASAVATRIPSDVPLRIFPLGTENLLASHFGYKRDIDSTLQSIEHMKTKQIDAASANGKLFLVVAGIGFDADVVRRLHTNRKGHIRRWQYWWHILASTFCYRFPKLRIVDLKPDTGASTSIGTAVRSEASVAWLFIQNFPCYADRLQIANDSSEVDGLLNVSSFKQGGFFAGLRYLLALRMGWHRSLSDFQTTLLERFVVEQDLGQNSPFHGAEPLEDQKHADQKRVDPFGKLESSQKGGHHLASYQIDGDWGGLLPVEFQVLPKRVTIVL